MKILVTGFTRYKPFESNASEELVCSFQSDLPGELSQHSNHLIFSIISFEDGDPATQSRTMTTSLFALLEECAPDVCIFCGQAPRSNKILVEKIAISVFRGTPITTEGPVAYASTLPGQDELPGVMKRNGIPFALSYHAGIHLCNHILYSTLHHAVQEQRTITAGFVHVPLSERPAVAIGETSPHSDVSFMPLAMSRFALTLIINNTIENIGTDVRPSDDPGPVDNRHTSGYSITNE